MSWLDVAKSLSDSKVSVADHVVRSNKERDQEELVNLKRKEILALLQYNTNWDVEKKLEESNLTDDLVFFRSAFTKYPLLAYKIGTIISKTILDNEEFMMEMYAITKCKHIFKRGIGNVDLLIRLMKIDIDFFSFIRDSISYNPSKLLKIIANFPIIRTFEKIPSFIAEDYKMVFDCITNLNEIKTFLLSHRKIQIKGMFPFIFNSIRHKVCSYLSVFPERLVKKFIGDIPVSLTTKCRCNYHTCNHCIKITIYKDIFDKLSLHDPTPSVRHKIYLVKNNLDIVGSWKCTGIGKYTCQNCLNAEDRKLWYETIRKQGHVYGIRVL